MIDDFKPAKKPAGTLPTPSSTKTKKIIQPLNATKKDLPLPNTTEPEQFRTPEEIAAEDALLPKGDADVSAQDSAVTTKKRIPRMNLSWPPGKKELLAALGSIIVVGGLVTGLYLVLHKAATTTVTATSIHTIKPIKKVAPKPITVASNLSGLQVAPELNNKPVIGVMIENSLDARPQSGLSQASTVFEAIAEGGITRFLALFQDTQPANVGPIRSSRPYYLEWALGFDAGYAHVGGSPEALADIKAWKVRDLDQFANGNSYHRVASRDAPHNVYTAVSTLTDLAASKGYTSSTFTSFPRKKETPTKVPTAKTINLALSGPSFNVHYDYDATTNSYKRSEGGQPHLDAEGAVQISPKVVIALVMQYGYKSDGYHSGYNTLGSGQAYIYQDGTVTLGSWTKTADTSQFVFTDGANKPIALNPGQTWITAVSSSVNVSAAP
jgi:hypothetical protein